MRENPGLTGSGRTDTGVHARGQVAHFDTTKNVDVYRLKASLNGLLSNKIGILSLEVADDNFHARYDAVQRQYHYYVSTEKRPLTLHQRALIRPIPNFEAMNAAARIFLGSHNFSAFCKTKSETKNRICNVQEVKWIKDTHEGDWFLKIVADRFLHGMVRAITGTLLEVGHDKRSIKDIEDIITSENRINAGPAAPAHGLVLEKVSYAK